MDYLLDYFFNGTPDVQFSKQVSDKYIPTERWEQLTDFNEIQDTYFKALQKLRDHNKLVEDTVSIYKAEKRNIFTPPVDMEFSKSRSSGFKKFDKLQLLSGEQESEGGLVFPDEDDTPNWSAPDENADSEAGKELAGYQQEQAGSEAGAAEAELSDDEESDEERDDAWLAAVRYSPNGTEVCFEMANKGTC